MKEYKAIKVKKEVYECIVELKKVIIQKGIKSLPEDLMERLKNSDFKFNSVSMGNMITLCIQAITYLLERN